MSRPPLEPGVYQEVLGGKLNYEAVIVTKPGNEPTGTIIAVAWRRSPQTSGE
jgi:hypothetical protein